MALRSYGTVIGLVVGPHQGASEHVHTLLGESADVQAVRHWRLMGARDRAGARSIFVDHGQRRWSAVFWRSWVRCLRARRICIGRYDDTSIQVGGPPESIEREHRWHAQELAEAFMERFPEEPIVFATEDWRGDRD